MDNSYAQTLDVEKVIASKAGDKKVPKFLVNWLKKAIHQDFFNVFLQKGYYGVDFCENTLKYLNINLEIDGMENLDSLPDDARITFASNHPLGGVDGVAMGMIVGRRYDGRVRYLVNDLLMNLKGLAPICVPINKFGGQARNLPKLIDDAFRSDDQMIIFPAGLCSRKNKGIIRDGKWGKSFIKKSVETGRYIVPVHFIGENSKRFYRVANLCKVLKIKFNFAMLLLPDELYKARNGKYKVIIGKPIEPTFFDSSKSHTEWAQWVKELAYSL